MLGFIDKLYEKKISSKGLGVFRVCFSFVLLLEINRIYRYKELYYDIIPFIQSVDFNYSLILIFWQLCLLAILFGFFTRFFAFFSYLIGYFLINDFGVYEYHMDYVYLGVSFLLIFIPTEKSYSIDSIFERKLNYGNSVQKTSVLSYYSIVFVGIALVYFGSIYFKIKSNAWLSGLGIWLPCSLPQVSITNNQWILNQEYLIKTIGYIALFFEFIFIFTFFLKKWRLLLCVLGILMHIGISIVFPIPYFAFGYVAMYLLLIPVSFWEKSHIIFNKKYTFLNINLDFLSPLYTLYYRLKTFKIVDLTKKRVFKTFFVAICILQINSTINLGGKSITNLIKKNIDHSENSIVAIRTTVKTIRHYSQEFLGLTGHGVFVDGHYIGFDKIVTLKYKNQFLPLYDMHGMPGEYLKSGIWANYNFRVNKPFVFKSKFGKNNLQKGLIRYSAFWANENKVELNNTEFKIMIKTIKASFTWEENLLENNLSQPWEPLGTLTWENSKASIKLK